MLGPVVVALLSLYARRRLVILAFIIVLRPVITRGRGDPRYGFAVVTHRDERTANPAEVIRARLQRAKLARSASRRYRRSFGVDISPRYESAGINVSAPSGEVREPRYCEGFLVTRKARASEWLLSSRLSRRCASAWFAALIASLRLHSRSRSPRVRVSRAIRLFALAYCICIPLNHP